MTRYKVCLLSGQKDVAVGTTSVVRRIIQHGQVKTGQDSQLPDYAHTIYCAVKTKGTVFTDERGNAVNINIELWDFSHRDTTNAFDKSKELFSSSKLQIIVVDVSRPQDEEYIKSCINKIRKITGKKQRIVLVGNKSDKLTQSIQNREQTLISIANRLGVVYIPTSAFNNIGFEFVMQEIRDALANKPYSFKPLEVKKSDELLKDSYGEVFRNIQWLGAWVASVVTSVLAIVLFPVTIFAMYYCDTNFFEDNLQERGNYFKFVGENTSGHGLKP